MIEHTLDTAHSILYLRPKSTLEESDFVQLAEAVDPYIEENGDLEGIIIEVPEFPGWENLGAFVSHIRFVRDHHRRINRVALVTDSAMANVAETIASHFVSAEVRHFSAEDLDSARQWIMDSTSGG